MGDLADLLDVVPPGANPAVAPEHHAPLVRYTPGWEPRVTHGDDQGEAVSEALTGETDEAGLLRGWGLDPEAWEIIPGTLLVNRWQQHSTAAGSVWLYQYKAKLRKRVAALLGDDPDLAGIIKRWKPLKRKRSGDHAIVVNLADWQAGKGEGGGSEALVERVMSSIDAADQRITDLRGNVDIGQSVIVGMGDLVEQCFGGYASQQFTTDLNRREQMRLARRLLAAAISRLGRRTERCTVATVGGNHGENRVGSGSGGKGVAFTDPGDNDDVAVFESLAEEFRHRDGFDHLRWVIPETELSVLVDCGGVPVGFTHGHLARKGSTPAQKQIEWWKGQTMGDHPVAGARVLVTAHYHHLIIQQTHGKWFAQCPANDGGSRWFTDSTGDHSPAGTLTFLSGPSGDLFGLEVV